MNRPRRCLAAMVVLALPLSAGCTTFGPRTVPASRLHYSEALARSWNELLLLNLVRLRYRDTPQFLDVGSIVTQFSISAGLSASAALPEGSPDTLGLGGSLGYGDAATISFAPLAGEEFVNRLLAPISPTTLLLLSQSGWSISRLLECCVAELHRLENAPTAAGPTPRRPPRYVEFQRLARRLQELQNAGALGIRVTTGAERDPVLELREPADPSVASAADDVRRLVGFGPTADRLTLTVGEPDEDHDVTILGRSLLGVTFFLSQAVEPPPAHEAAGLVTVTRDETGERFDWGRLTGGLLRVQSRVGPPEAAFVRIFYRGHWFFIDDRDLDSKTTFGLLTYLFSLQSTPQARSPLLTLPAGR